MYPYRIDMATAEELEADPFGGHGVFLPLTNASGEDILIRLEEVFGRVLPAVAAPQQGAWVDSEHAGLGQGELLARWEA